MSSGGAEEIDRLKNEVSRLRRSLNVLVKALVENATLDAAVAGPITRLLRDAESLPPEVAPGTELCARCGVPLSGDDTNIYVRDVGTVCTGCYRSHDGR